MLFGYAKAPTRILDADIATVSGAADKVLHVAAARPYLLGLRYSPDLAAQLFRGVLSMKESSTYRAILEEGRQEGRQEGFAEGSAVEARKLLRLFGDARLGVPDAETAAAIEAIEEVACLEELCARLSSAESWRELLGRSSHRSRKGRRHSSP